jgi:polar amino acid transport system substrate-binding protein
LLLLTLALALSMAQAGTLEDIRQRGVLVAGVKDSLPPFGYVDPVTRSVVGYDVDFVRALADRLGVKLELKPVTSANRIPQLVTGNIDIIAATMTKNPERARQIDFSHAYFLTGQKFLVRKGSVRTLKDLEGKRIATAKGSTSEQNARHAVPSATILAFDDYPQAFLALRQGRVAAVTTDEAILAGILAKAPDKGHYEIAALRISDEPYGLGMRKGDAALVAFVNRTLLDMERSGEARLIFERWFGQKSEAPMKRDFVISADR